MLNVAVPPLSVPVPKAVDPLLKVTVPVGAVVPLVGFTTAVKVTLDPTLDCEDEGFAVMASVVVVEVSPVVGEPTVNVTAGEVDVAKFASPL